MEALGAEKTIEAELHIFGIMGNNDAYRHRIERLLKEDSRIFFHGELHRKCFFMTLRNFDIMAIPSQPMEVAPLVVMEAYAAGLPVMASSIGGLTEMVEHGINGLLLPHDSVAAWRQTILQLSKDWELLKRLRQGVRMPRTMSDVAGDMSELYRKILDHCGAK
jgi:glycosyltransferase involved in cell wall biosynthesis